MDLLTAAAIVAALLALPLAIITVYLAYWLNRKALDRERKADLYNEALATLHGLYSLATLDLSGHDDLNALRDVAVDLGIDVTQYTPAAGASPADIHGFTHSLRERVRTEVPKQFGDLRRTLTLNSYRLQSTDAPDNLIRSVFFAGRQMVPGGDKESQFQSFKSVLFQIQKDLEVKQRLVLFSERGDPDGSKHPKKSLPEADESEADG